MESEIDFEAKNIHANVQKQNTTDALITRFVPVLFILVLEINKDNETEDQIIEERMYNNQIKRKNKADLDLQIKQSKKL